MTKLYKYPRTPHLPWSPGRTDDDKTLDNVDHFEGIELVGTIKYDGENTTMYRDYIHARSLSSGHHPSRTWVKGFHAAIKNSIPEGWRICGENLYAKHSISYHDLTSYFYAFSVWNDDNECLSWAEFEEFCNELGIYYVQPFAIGTIRKINKEFQTYFNINVEGYVIRPLNKFKYEDFGRCVAKYVRANHVQIDEHWMYQKMELNTLKD